MPLFEMNNILSCVNMHVNSVKADFSGHQFPRIRCFSMSYDYLVTGFVCLFVCRIIKVTGWIAVEFGVRVGKITC